MAVPDSGINPYHALYYRPENTKAPCTYIPDFPCDIEKLQLSVGLPYDQALAQDQAVWANVQPGKWYWIPQTVFVAVSCDSDTTYRLGMCILNEPNQGDGGHGTGTTSSVIMENPDALIAFREGGPDTTPFRTAGLPIDIYSVSWGYADPVVGLSIVLPLPGCVDDIRGLYIKSSGNEPGFSTLADCWAGHPDVISVGGAFAQGRTQYAASGKDMDVVSYYCRPAAAVATQDGMKASFCGTSFAAPTVAGALSKVIYQIRVENGYTGSIQGDVLEPTSGLTVGNLRDALNRTASYNPTPRYTNSNLLGVPLNPAAPYTQWGWGFYDADVADATLAFLRGTDVPDKSADAKAYMAALYAEREALWG